MKKILFVISIGILFALFSCKNGKTPNGGELPPAKEKFAVTVSDVQDGSITVKKGDKTLEKEELKAVEKDSILTFVLTANEKAKVRTLQIDEQKYETIENAKITATVKIEKAITVQGVVDKIFAVTIKAVKNGKIEALDGENTLTSEQLAEVRNGTSLTFKLIPNDGYRAKSLKLDDDTYTNDDENNLVLEKNLVITKDMEVSGVVEENKTSKEYEIEKDGKKVTFTMLELPEANNVKLGGDYMNGTKPVDNKNNKEHTVSISQFYLCSTEVTQELYQIIMEENPSNFQGDDKKPDPNESQEKRPVEKVTWYEAVAFCNALTKKVLSKSDCLYYSDAEFTKTYTKEDAQHKNGDKLEPKPVFAKWEKKGFRLPTDCEWEWAAGGGTSFKYAGSDDLNEVAWWRENSNAKTHQVALKKSNGYGLYDMSGNVGEWCWDWFASYTNGATLEKDYKGPESSASLKNKSFRPASYSMPAILHLNVARGNGKGMLPEKSLPALGFRIAKNK